MALMTYQQIVNRNTDYAILLCFLSGIVQLIMAVFHLGKRCRFFTRKGHALHFFFYSGVLIDFISVPVTVGFTSATSVIIATSQLKSLLGLKITASGFVDTISKVFMNIHKTRIADFSLGLVCIGSLLLLRVWCGPQDI